MIFFLNKINRSQLNQPEKLQNAPPVGAARRYQQANRLADMSVGRIRRWNMPFRRPFLL
ncbi:MAG: hypothetical protein AAF992_05665 [Bacteroidota bacterium]